MSEIFKIQLRRDTESGTIIRTISVEQSFVVSNVDAVDDTKHGNLGLNERHSIDTVIAAWKPVVNEPFSFHTDKLAIENAEQQVRKYLSEGFNFFPTTEELRIANTGNPQSLEDEIQRRNRLTFGPEQLQKQLKGY